MNRWSRNEYTFDKDDCRHTSCTPSDSLCTRSCTEYAWDAGRQKKWGTYYHMERLTWEGREGKRLVQQENRRLDHLEMGWQEIARLEQDKKEIGRLEVQSLPEVNRLTETKDCPERTCAN